MQLFRRLFQFTSVATGVTLVAVLISFQTARAQSSSGAIHVNVRACASDAKAQVVVKSISTTDPGKIAEGASGAPISVPEGTYDLEITCTEMIDHPTHDLRGVKVAAGETVEREVNFPCGQTILHVRKGGRSLTKNEMAFKNADGEELPGKGNPGTVFKATPGQYEAVLFFGRGRRKTAHGITGIQVYDGAKRNISVDL